MPSRTHNKAEKEDKGAERGYETGAPIACQEEQRSR